MTLNNHHSREDCNVCCMYINTEGRSRKNKGILFNYIVNENKVFSLEK